MRDVVLTIADRLRELILSGHPRSEELSISANNYDLALSRVTEPQKNWPDPVKSKIFNEMRVRALRLYRECGGSEDVYG